MGMVPCSTVDLTQSNSPGLAIQEDWLTICQIVWLVVTGLNRGMQRESVFLDNQPVFPDNQPFSLSVFFLALESSGNENSEHEAWF